MADEYEDPLAGLFVPEPPKDMGEDDMAWLFDPSTVPRDRRATMLPL